MYIYVMKRLVISFIVGCLALPVFSQSSIDLFSITGRYGVPTEYRTIPELEGTETALMVNLKLPLRFGDKYIWYNELTYSNFMVSSDTTFAPEIYHPIDLHGFILQTGLMARLSSATALQLLFVPRYMTDFDGSSPQNWQFGILGMYEKRYKETLMLRFGAIIHQDLFGPNITPVVYTDWRIGDRWSVVGMWPVFGKVNYQLSENTVTGFSHFGLTTTYRLGGEVYNSDYMERNSIDLGLFLRQRLFGNFHLEGRIGYALNRKYSQYKEDDKLGLRILIFSIEDNRTPVQENIANGVITSLRLVYNLSLEDN